MNNYENLIKKLLREESERYMFFSNLEQMKRQCEMLLEMDRNTIEEILHNGHDWAQDHIAEAKNNMDQVFDFLMNEINGHDNHSSIVSESKLDFIIGKPISLIKRLHTTKYNPDSGRLEKVERDEEIEGEIVGINDDDPFSVPTMVVKCPDTTCHIMYEENKDRFVEGESTFSYEYIPTSNKDSRILNLFKDNYYSSDEDIIQEGRKKKNVATNQKLWKQSLAWAKQRYEVCPSAYCNGAAVKRYNSKGGKWKKV